MKSQNQKRERNWKTNKKHTVAKPKTHVKLKAT